MSLSVEERFALIKQVGEEILSEDELSALLKEKKSFVAYDGFEPSGRIHLAQAVLRAVNVNRMITAGAEFTMFVADWHAWANNKLGGDLEKIQTTGKYFIEVWKASGMNLDHVRFVWSSDLVKKDEYWKLVMKVATATTLKRILRTTQIMGRSENDQLQASQILYPCMQAADIFYLKADVCQLGMDQRKVNVLARELAATLGYPKPIIVSHHMLMGLSEPPKDVTDAVARATAMKMSKSKPDTAIFVTDTKEEVERKLRKAYCPEGEANENPVLEYCKYLVFALKDAFVVERPEKFGGPITFTSYEALERAFVEKQLHPTDLKVATAKYLNAFLEPIRTHFAHNEEARRLQALVASYETPRSRGE